MDMEYVRHLIWDLAMELTFDCFYAGNTFPVPQKNPIVLRLKSSVILMTTHIENLLANHLTRDSFQTALHFLGDVELQIQIAMGLGFMEEGKCKQLGGMAASLRKLMNTAH